MNPVIELTNFYKKNQEENGCSLRDFSQMFLIHPTTMCKILKVERAIPKSKAISMAKIIFQKENQRAEFVRAILEQPKSSNSKKMSKEPVEFLDDKTNDLFQIISQWEFFAILNLIKVKKFDHSVNFISGALGISVKKVKYCLNILERNHFVDLSEGKIIRIVKNIKTTTDVFSRALQLAHLEELNLAKEKVEIEIKRKYYQSSLYTIKMSDLPRLKKLIDNMFDRADDLIDESKGAPDEVYLLSTQLFPLSNCQSDKLKKGLLQ